MCSRLNIAKRSVFTSSTTITNGIINSQDETASGSGRYHALLHCSNDDTGNSSHEGCKQAGKTDQLQLQQHQHPCGFRITSRGTPFITAMKEAKWP